MVQTWRFGLFLGALSTLLMLASEHIPYIGAFLLSLGLLTLQQLCDQKILGSHNHTWSTKKVSSLIVSSLILFPSSVLMGSSMGILSSPQSLLYTLPLSIMLLTLSVYFYLVLAHALRLQRDREVHIGKAIDIVGIGSFRKFGFYCALSFYLGILIGISGLLWGGGFIFTLPLLFYVSHFSYNEVRTLLTSESSLPQ